MSRLPRKKSKMNSYHIMSRSINKELLFNEDGDYLRYLSLLKKVKTIFNLKIYAYCLMTNHVHLLVEGTLDDIAKAMQRLNSSYALFFNTKYGRVGYVFSDRYKSENIETEDYFLKCIRYIHQNPVKALMCKNISQYKFTSIHAYKKLTSNYLKLVDATHVLKKFKNANEFVKFNEAQNQDSCMEFFNNRYDDKKLRFLLYDFLNVGSLKDYDKLSMEKKMFGAKKLLNMHVTIKQTSRVTGLYYNKVQKLKFGIKEKPARLTYPGQ